jgi:nucleoside-diphosphate-sugar epimerase
MESINLRLFSVYGPDLREDSVPNLIGRAILERRPFKILGDGSSQRDYVDVNDVLDAFQAALACPWAPDFPTAINIGSGTGTTLRHLIELLEARLGMNLIRDPQPPVHGEIPAIVADIGLAQKVLGYRPSITLEAGLARLANWFRSGSMA